MAQRTTNSLCIVLNKSVNFNKNETESKMENPTYSFRDMNLVLQLIEESQINRAFFVPFILSEGNFFNICVYANI